MAKVKNKRNSGLADKVNSKRKGEVHKKKMNPFEVHINKEKLKVLGKKSKHDRGLPGVSRSKALQKRKEIVASEMRMASKSNLIIDRRIGERDNQLSTEDRMVARFTAERARQHDKNSIFNLADDEILTHRGQSLEQIEKFDDPRSSDDENEVGSEFGKKFGVLDDEMVSEGHFGGGMLSKAGTDGAKSHKDLIEQLIAESKKRKAEKQKEKEQTLDLTEKLDSEWKDLQPVVFKRAKVDENESLIDKVLSKAEKQAADYDKMMRELKFEKRGTPSDAIKTDEKQAKEEKQRLEQFETERLQRMYEDSEVVPKTSNPLKHRSADDLDDNLEIQNDDEYMLAYNDEGKPLIPHRDFQNKVITKKHDDGISDTSSEEDNNEENDDEVSENEEKQSEDKKESDYDDESDDNEEEKQVNRNIKDKEKIRNSSEKSDVEKKLVEEKTNQNKDSKETNEIKKDDEYETVLFKNAKSSDDEDSVEESGDEESGEEEESSDEEELKEESKPKDDFADLKSDEEKDSDNESVDEKDTEKIGAFFDVKNEEGENLKELLTGKTPSQQATAIQKLIKSNNPGLGENNKENLCRLYAHMLQYINDIFSNLTNEGDVIKAFLVFDKLAPYFYDLAHTNKVSTKKFLVAILAEKHKMFKKNYKKVPDLDTLIFFKLVSLIYPTSDFNHPVTTPALVFMSEILRCSRFQTRYAISRGLFITALILEYTSLSKRLVPASINFLRGILYNCANTSILNPIQVVPPFRLHRDAKILNLEDDCSKMAVENKMAAKDLVLNEIDNDFKIRSLLSITLMMKEFFDYFNDLEAQECMFEPHLNLYSRIDLEIYPKKVAKIVKDTLKYIKESLEVKTFTPLVLEKKKLKLLRLYEPDIQEVFTGSKSSKLSKDEAQKRRLQNRIKQEMKGTLRELRRDRAYIARMKIRQKIQSDNIRKEKVKQIYKDASIQQGELNKLKRMK